MAVLCSVRCCSVLVLCCDGAVQCWCSAGGVLVKCWCSAVTVLYNGVAVQWRCCVAGVLCNRPCCDNTVVAVFSVCGSELRY